MTENIAMLLIAGAVGAALIITAMWRWFVGSCLLSKCVWIFVCDVPAPHPHGLWQCGRCKTLTIGRPWNTSHEDY